MKVTSATFLKAVSLSITLMGSTAVIATFSVPDYAYAKGSNGGGNGGGNSGGSADKSDNGASAGASARSGSKSRTSTSRGFSLKSIFGGKKTKSNAQTTKRTTAKTQRKAVVATPAKVIKATKQAPKAKGYRLSSRMMRRPIPWHSRPRSNA